VVYRGIPMPGSMGGGVMSETDPSPYPGSAVRVAVIDLRNGDVLWADFTSDFRSFKDSRMDDIAEDFVAQMP
jgi:hypothetical protein